MFALEVCLYRSNSLYLLAFKTLSDLQAVLEWYRPCLLFQDEADIDNAGKYFCLVLRWTHFNRALTWNIYKELS